MTLYFSGSMPRRSREYRHWLANASLSSHRSMSSTVRPWRFEQAGHGEHRTDAHLVGLAAGDGPAPERAQRRQAAALGLGGLHQHDGGGAVGQLAGVAGGDVVALAADRLQLGQALERRRRAVALVPVDDVVDDRLLLRLAVDELHLRRHRHDLLGEQPVLLGGGHALLGLQRVLVLGLAADAVALGDDVGGLDHRHVDGRVHLAQLGVHVRRATEAGVGHGDRLDAAGDDDVGAVLLDVVGGEGDGVEARRAVALDRGPGRRDGQAGEQARQPGQVAGAVGAVAEVDVLDGVGLDLRTSRRRARWRARPSTSPASC